MKQTVTDKMSYWKRNLFLLWFSQLMVMAGFSAMIPFIPLFMENQLQLTGNKLTLYISLFSFFGTMAYAVFCPVWGVLSDRFGIKPMLLRGTFVTAFFFPLMGYVRSPDLLIALRFVTAACAGTTAASHIMIARTAPDERQGFAQGVLSTAIWGGAMLGNVIGGLIIHYYSYLCAFWFCGILYAVAGISVLFTKDNASLKAPAKVRKKEKHAGMPYLPAFTRSVWILLCLFFVMGIIRNFEQPYIALKIKQLSSAEMAAYWTGIVSAVVCCGAILSGAFTGYLADRMAPRRLLLPVMLLSALGLILQGAAHSLWFFTAARTLLYIAAGGLQPLLQKFLSALTPARKRGSVFGFSTAGNCGGGMIAAILSGWSIVVFGLNGVFYTGGLLFLLTLPLFLRGLQFAMKQPYFLAHSGESIPGKKRNAVCR